MGIVFFGIGWLSLLLWKINKNEPIKELLNVALMLALLTLPFYLHNGFQKYMVGIIAHNPELDSNLALGITALTLTCYLLALIIYKNLSIQKNQYLSYLKMD